MSAVPVPSTSPAATQSPPRARALGTVNCPSGAPSLARKTFTIAGTAGAGGRHDVEDAVAVDVAHGHPDPRPHPGVIGREPEFLAARRGVEHADDRGLSRPRPLHQQPGEDQPALQSFQSRVVSPSGRHGSFSRSMSVPVRRPRRRAQIRMADRGRKPSSVRELVGGTSGPDASTRSPVVGGTSRSRSTSPGRDREVPPTGGPRFCYRGKRHDARDPSLSSPTTWTT